MNKKIKWIALALFAGAFIAPAYAQDELLQAVNVDFTFYSQGAAVVQSNGNTNNVVDHQGFGIKDLIKDLKGSAFANGDLLVRVTVTPILSTNITAIVTTNLELTNISSSTEFVTNEVIFGGNTTVIDDTNLVFGTNVVSIGGTNVTLGANIATLVSNSGTSFTIGTNTTVTVSNLTNAAGYITGTNYAFTINALTVVTNSKASEGYWSIYNTHSKTFTAISSNVLFNIYTAHVYDSPTNLAYVHGETVKRNGEIEFGTTDEIRAFVLSNSTVNIKLKGYAKGRLIPVSLSGSPATSIVYSQDYNWEGSGSGLISNTVPAVIEGGVTESFYKLIKP